MITSTTRGLLLPSTLLRAPQLVAGTLHQQTTKSLMRQRLLPGVSVSFRGMGRLLPTVKSRRLCALLSLSRPVYSSKCSLFAYTVLYSLSDYIKVDGCGDNAYYPQGGNPFHSSVISPFRAYSHVGWSLPSGYQAMGAALEATGRPIVYSCSWPAYIGDNETQKPFNTFIMDGCNLWRNWCVAVGGFVHFVLLIVFHALCTPVRGTSCDEIFVIVARLSRCR